MSLAKEMVKVVKTGAGVSLQGAPRVGLRRWGVAGAGAMDRTSLALANELLMNRPEDTGLELIMGGAKIELLENSWLSHVGRLGCEELLSGRARFLQAGTVLEFTPTGKGNFSYISIPGGFRASEVFGSMSRHEASNLGDRVEAGDRLGAEPGGNVFHPVTRRLIRLKSEESREFKVWPGPHLCEVSSPDELSGTSLRLSSASDRSGYRLEGGPSGRAIEGLRSLPVFPGCMQLTPDGTVIICLNDGPTVGGYPLVGVVDPADLPRLVQVPIGSDLTFQFYEDLVAEL